MSILFNESFYLSHNPDVAAAISVGVFLSGKSHWDKYGQFEGRSATPFFDAQVYRSNNPDLVEAGLLSNAQLMAHFNQYGWSEGRIFMNSDLFNHEYYAQQNPDLALAGVTGQPALLRHFVTTGIYEGRAASALVGGATYIDQNPDLKAWLNAGGSINGITDRDAAGIYHYYNYGIYEGRPAVPALIVEPPEFNWSVIVGVDGFINLVETSGMTGITATITSGTIPSQTLLVSQSQSGTSIERTAVYNPSRNAYEFDARVFQDGPLNVTATDAHGQTQTLVLNKDTVAPVLLDFSISGQNELSLSVSEAVSVGFFDYQTLMVDTVKTISTANTVTTIDVAAQSTVKTVSVFLLDDALNAVLSPEKVFLGTTGTDKMTGIANAKNFMFGFAGADTIMGGAQSDVIHGGNGNDTLQGGGGVDLIDVGVGLDTVVVGTVNTSGVDTVSGFGSNDTLKFSGNLSFWDDSSYGDLKSRGTLLEAAAYVKSSMDGFAIGFIYDGENYVLIDGPAMTNGFNPAKDAIVKLVGTNLATLSMFNFTA